MNKSTLLLIVLTWMLVVGGLLVTGSGLIFRGTSVKLWLLGMAIMVLGIVALFLPLAWIRPQ